MQPHGISDKPSKMKGVLKFKTLFLQYHSTINHLILLLWPRRAKAIERSHSSDQKAHSKNLKLIQSRPNTTTVRLLSTSFYSGRAAISHATQSPPTQQQQQQQIPPKYTRISHRISHDQLAASKSISPKIE